MNAILNATESPALVPECCPGNPADETDEALDPRKEAARIVYRLNAGLDAVIEAGVLAHRALEYFSAKPAELQEFKNSLAVAGVISTKEAKEGSRSKLYKLRKIGEHAGMLRHESIFRFLEPGYSILYAVVILFEAHGGRAAAAVAVASALARMVAERGYLQRQDIEAETIAIKGTPPRSALSGHANRPVSEFATLAGGENGDRSPDDRRHADLLLITPRKDDVNRMAEDYAEADALSRSLGIDRFGEVNRAIVVTTIGDLSVICWRLLPLLGLRTRPKVLLVRQTNGPDISDAKIIAIADRLGAKSSSASDVIDWPPDECVDDPIALTERFSECATIKAHLFADKETDGWDCYVGETTWLEMPSLK